MGSGNCLVVFHDPFFPFQPLFKLTKISLKFRCTPALRIMKRALCKCLFVQSPRQPKLSVDVTLFSSRHVRQCTNCSNLYKIFRRISDVWENTDFNLGEVSYLSISYNITIFFTLEQFSFECRKVIGFAFTTLRDWFKNFAPLFHPIRSKSKTNRDSLVRVLPHFASATCNYFMF